MLCSFVLQVLLSTIRAGLHRDRHRPPNRDSFCTLANQPPKPIPTFTTPLLTVRAQKSLPINRIIRAGLSMSFVCHPNIEPIVKRIDSTTSETVYKPKTIRYESQKPATRKTHEQKPRKNESDHLKIMYVIHIEGNVQKYIKTTSKKHF